MQQREQFLVAWISHEVSRTTLCQLFGISRQTGYKWVKRYERDRSVEERSRRPKTSPTTPSSVSMAVSVSATETVSDTVTVSSATDAASAIRRRVRH
jgi:transposase-like protein